MASQQSRSTQKRDEPSRQQSGPTRHLEIETKLEIGAGTALPELAGRRSLATVGLAAAAGPVVHELDAVYFDTVELDLLRSKLTLRHRTGGDDAGWHLKLPAVAGARTEIGLPLEADHRDRVISSMKRSERDGKVFIDWSQNNGAKTTVSPYSLRGRDHPMVAAPRTWSELISPGLEQLDYEAVLARVAEADDPLAAMAVPDAPDPGTERVDLDRLSTYRSMRRSSRCSHCSFPVSTCASVVATPQRMLRRSDC